MLAELLRTGLKGQVHCVLSKEGVIPVLREIWGPAGFEYFNQVCLGDGYEYRLESLRDLVKVVLATWPRLRAVPVSGK